ncbi:MAG: agmatinase family protein [Conexivisphaerales archaeon]
MRRPVSYPEPSYNDIKDKRFISLITAAEKTLQGSINLVGIPYDGATLGRKGSAQAPAAIRNALRFNSNYDAQLGLDLTDLHIADLGDIVLPDEVFSAHEQIRKEIIQLIKKDSLLLVLGGDNSLSLPLIQSYSEIFGNIGLVVLDSHFDLRDEINGKPTSGSSYNLAMKNLGYRLSPSRVVYIGLHGFLNSVEYAREARKKGITIFTEQDVKGYGATTLAKRAYDIASHDSNAVYLSIDMDSVDLSYVSGVSAPSPAGLTALELYDISFYLASRKKIFCVDIVETSPPLDPTSKSEIVAANLICYLSAGFKARLKLL